MKNIFIIRFFLILAFLSQCVFTINRDLEWNGMSCWFDAFMHCLSEYDEMNDFLRSKYEKDPLSQVVLDSIKTMNKEQKTEFVKNNFARIYIALIDEIHDKGQLGSKDFFKKNIPINESKIGNITQIDLINSIGVFGAGNDPRVFYSRFFRMITEKVGALPGLTIKRADGGELCPMMQLLNGGDESSELEEIFARHEEILSGIKVLSRIVIFPIYEGVTEYEIKKNIIIKNKRYTFFAIMWCWLGGGHMWAYVKSKKDGCWYCYNSLHEKPADKIPENNLKLTYEARRDENMRPYVIFYELDEQASMQEELVPKLSELRRSLQVLKENLCMLQKKLAALRVKLAA